MNHAEEWNFRFCPDPIQNYQSNSWQALSTCISIREEVVRKHFQHSFKNSWMELYFHVSVVHTYEVRNQRKIHLAASEIMFHVIRDYNGAVQILVKSDLCTFLAILGSCVCSINIWNSFSIHLNHFDNNSNTSAIKSVHKISYQKGKRLFSNYVGI